MPGVGRGTGGAAARAALGLALLLLLISAAVGAVEDGDPWLRSVEPIVLGDERALYLSLGQEYQRSAFRRQFWRVRDPYPQTGRNEFRERYEERLGIAESRFGGLADDRSRILLTHGEPNRVVEVRCTTSRTPAVIWVYRDSELVDFGFVLVFLRGGNGSGPARIWHPNAGGSLSQSLRSARSCINGAVLEDVERQIVAAGPGYLARLDRILLKPRPRNGEWVAAFRAESTDVEPDAPRLPAGLAVDYLGRHGQRTAVQVVVEVAAEEAEVGDFAGHRSYDFLLVGEIVQGDDRFESFRYKFGFTEGQAQLPLVFQRFLRPGEHNLVVRVEDLNSGRLFRSERLLEVPELESEWQPRAETSMETRRLLREASLAMISDQPRITVVPPHDGLLTGFVRFATVTAGPGIERVAFSLDGGPPMVRNRPPFEVELDLGPFPRVRRVRADALDAAGGVLASHEIELNAGRQRFSARLLSPRPGQKAVDSVRAEVGLTIPDGGVVERVDLFVNQQLQASLYQEPWAQPLRLDPPGALAYVRAVAYLSDGNRAEDLVFLNAPGELEEVDIQFVELYVSVLQRDGSFARGLGADDFEVREGGVEQRLERFDLVDDLPIHVAVVLDNSASMRGALEEARRAVLSFFSEALTPQDRAAVITFNRFPNLVVPLTNDLRRLGGGLAGLSAEGQTSLYDSVVFGLYYLSGVSGQRAILLLSDGRDETSEFSFERTLEYARRAGVTIYTIGLGLPDGKARGRLVALARETGGTSHFIGGVGELEAIYRQIQVDLRAQYLLAYQSSDTSRSDSFRPVAVSVRGIPDSRVRTMSGYYP